MNVYISTQVDYLKFFKNDKHAVYGNQLQISVRTIYATFTNMVKIRFCCSTISTKQI